MQRFVWLAAIALVVVACGGGNGAPPTTPGTQPTAPGLTAAPTPGTTQGSGSTPQPNAGDLKAKAQALVPPGSAPLSELSLGNSYTIQVMSTQTLEQLGAFWTTAIPAAGMTESGRYTAGETLIIAFTNPDGGVTASATDDGVLVQISVGTSI